MPTVSERRRAHQRSGALGRGGHPQARWVVVVQRRSTSGANPKQKATLASLGLGAIGKRRHVRTDAPVLGMLRAVAHLVEVTDVRLPKEPAAADLFNVGREKMTITDYESSGGSSQLIQLATGEELTVEVHRESFALLWSTGLPVQGWLDEIEPMLPPAGLGTALLLDAASSDVRELAAEDIREAVAEQQRTVGFVRLEFEDRMLTFEPPEISRRHGARAFEPGAVGAVARGWHPEYLAECIRRTGTPQLAARTDELLRRAEPLVERFPAIDLYADVR